MKTLFHHLKVAAALAFSLLWADANSQTNPIGTYYSSLGKDYPGWTNDINWSNRLDMSAFPFGNNDFEKFENGRDSLYRMGGGVLYYPAGTYNFSDHPTGASGRGLMLRSGVVILGDAPSTDPAAIVDSVTPGLTTLGTKFLFPYRSRLTSTGGSGEYPDNWNCIGLMPEPGDRIGNVNHVGIAWVNLDAAYTYMGPDMPWGATYATAGGWRSARAKTTGENWAARVPDGTHYMDPFVGARTDQTGYQSGRYRFVFGCRFDNAAAPNDILSDAVGGTGATYDPDFLFNYRFGSRIAVYGSDVLVANNAIPKSNKSFMFQQFVGSRVPRFSADILFNYGQQGGIDINKQLVSLRSNRCNLDSGAFYETNIVLKDNYVYNMGGKGYEVSGKWVVVENNINNRDYLDRNASRVGLTGNYTLTLDGYLVAIPTDDNLSRAFDFGGQNLWIHKNWYQFTGSDPGNDGEGLLIQRHGGVECFSWAWTYNGQGNIQPGELGGIAPWDVHCIGLFQGWNRTYGSVGIINVRSNEIQDAASVENMSGNGSPKPASRPQNAGNLRDFLTTCPTGTVQPPINVVATTVDSLRAIDVTWEDNSTEEVAFRVDRRIVGSADWQTIAYRPRNETGGQFAYSGDDNGPTMAACIHTSRDLNEQRWLDYQAPIGIAVEYRVAAITCTDAGSPTTSSNPATVTSVANAASKSSQQMIILPNPASGLVAIRVGHQNQSMPYIIYSASGFVALRGQLQMQNGQSTLDIHGLKTGLYLVKVVVDGQVVTSKLVVN